MYSCNYTMYSCDWRGYNVYIATVADTPCTMLPQVWLHMASQYRAAPQWLRTGNPRVKHCVDQSACWYGAHDRKMCFLRQVMPPAPTWQRPHSNLLCCGRYSQPRIVLSLAALYWQAKVALLKATPGTHQAAVVQQHTAVTHHFADQGDGVGGPPVAGH